MMQLVNEDTCSNVVKTVLSANLCFGSASILAYCSVWELKKISKIFFKKEKKSTKKLMLANIREKMCKYLKMD